MKVVRPQATEADSKSGLSFAQGTSESRDPDGVEFLRASGLPMSALVLGLFDQSDDCIKILDSMGRLQFMNCNGRQAMEIDDLQAFQGCEWPELWPEEARALVAEAVVEANAGKLSRFEAFCPTAKGTPRWWEVTVSPIMAQTGEVAAILSSSRDITHRKMNEQALATVATEMKHRLRNAYTVGAAISTLTGREYSDGKQVGQVVAERLARLADVQSSLIDAEKMSLTDLVFKTVRAFDAHGRIKVQTLPEVLLSESAARALALVLGELCTNSLKHGSLSGRGSVEVKASVDGDILAFEWNELHDRTHEDSSAQSTGLGRGLMDAILKSVAGKIESGVSDQGYQASLMMRV